MSIVILFQMLLFLFLFFIHQTKSCPLTDEYLSRCQCGILTNSESYIKCNEKSLNEIPKFKRSFPYDQLILSNNNIKSLPSSSFDNIKTIRRINLQENSLSFIDPNLLRLLGNYLEELILTGDNQINSLEFLTRYPLQNLRVLKLDQFNLSEIDLSKIFINMTKLEIVYLRSCQLKQIPIVNQIQILDLEKNFLSETIFLSTSYLQLNLARNQISSIILQANANLVSLNISQNILIEFYSLTISNKKLKFLDLSSNHLSSIDWTMLNENLTYLNLNSNEFLKINLNFLPKNLLDLSLKNNHLKQITFPKSNSSLISLDLSSNQLKTIEKNLLFPQLTSLNLNHNPLECNCHSQWLKQYSSTWVCSLPCHSMPRVNNFNITYISLSSKNALWIQWSIIDDYHTIKYLQISIDHPYRLSSKLRANQTRVFLLNNIELNQRYHICLILTHKYARDKYCRDINIVKSMMVIVSDEIELRDDELIFNDKQETIKSEDFIEKNFYSMLIAACKF
jgi:Leucine-rich repeat (LRR) protein